MLDEYLDVFYGGGLRESAEGVFCVLDTPPGDDTPWPPITEPKLRRLAQHPGARAFYLSIMSAFPDETGRYRNRRAQFASLHCIPLDDLGGKVPRTTLLPPTALLETSAGNFQAHYILREPIDDVALAEQVIRAVYGSALTDSGGKLVNKFVRLPVGVNGKLRNGERDLFEVRLAEWNPEALYTWQELLAAWGLELSEPAARAPATAPVAGVVDPVLDWLVDQKRVVGPERAGWVEVECPWAAEHTSGGSTAAYSPLGRGELSDWRGFKCHHAHCSGRRIDDFLAWVGERRGPEVTAFDPLSVAVQRFALVAEGSMVADLWHTGPSHRLQAWTDWRLAHMVSLPGDGRRMSLAEAWVRSPRMRRYAGLAYDPRAGRDIASGADQWLLNTYRAPAWPVLHGEPTWFIEHIRAILPHDNEAEQFLDWLAFKFQHPGKRSWGVVMVAHEAFGIGRSIVGRALELLLPRQVRTITVDEVLGEGSQAQYNDWEYGSLFVVLNEVKETLFSVRQDSQHYEQAKRKADPLPIMTRIRPKYGRIFEAEVFYNLLMFSNHLDAVRLPADDRRFAVFTNTQTRRSSAEYAQFLAQLENPTALAELYWWLMRREVSAFDHARPPETRGKTRMIESTTSEVEEAWKLAVERLPGGAVTLRQLMAAVTTVCLNELEDPALADTAKRYARRRYRQLGDDVVLRVEGKATRCRVLRPEAFRNPKSVTNDQLREELAKNGGATVIPIR